MNAWRIFVAMKGNDRIFIFLFYAWMLIQMHNIVPHHHHSYEDITFNHEYSDCSYHGHNHNNCAHGDDVVCNLNTEDFLVSALNYYYIPAESFDFEIPDVTNEFSYFEFDPVPIKKFREQRDFLRGPPQA